MTPAQDLTALADKLDERLEALEARLRNEADLEESMGFVSESIVSRNRLATVSEARATLTAALREAARMREALEKIANHATGGVGCNPAGFVQFARAALESPHGA